MTARQAIRSLAISCDDYYEEYQSLPLASIHTEDHTILTTGENPQSLMMTLVGFNSPTEESANHYPFFEYKRSKKNKTDGLHRTENTAELFDPWGNPYHVLLDYDSDKKLKDPHTGKIIKGQRVLIWSPGPDKKSGTDDDIYSWK